jgi:hypothetical protein
MDFGLGRFGDLRLEKGGPISMRPLLSGRALVSGGWQGADRRRSGSRGSFAIPR